MVYGYICCYRSNKRSDDPTGYDYYISIRYVKVCCKHNNNIDNFL